MKKLLFAGLFLFPVFVAAEAGVSQAQLTSAIVERQPVDDLQGQVSVPATTIVTVYFFTQVSELQGQQVVHRWLYKQEPMAEVVLEIGADNWRTYSSKQIRSDWTGDWQIQVWVNEQMLSSYDFQVNRED